MSARLVVFLALTSLPSLPSTVRAQPAADVNLDTSSADASLEQMVVLAAKRPQPLREAPASTSVITASDLEAYGWRNFTEAIQSLAGFYTTSPGDSTYIGVRGVSLRGDNNGRILILVDGHTQQELWSHSAYPELLGLDATMIDHIEVLRGPASSLYGSLGFLAIINVVTRRGTDHDWVHATLSAQDLDTFRGVVTVGHRGDSGLDWGLALQSTLGRGSRYTYDLPSVAGGCDPMRFGNACGTSVMSDRAVDAGDGFSAYGHLDYKGLAVRASYQYWDKKIPFAPFGTLFNDPANHYLTTRAYLDASYTAGRPESVELTARAYLDQAEYLDDLANPPDAMHSGRWIFHDEAHPWWTGGEVKLLAVREPSDRLRVALTGGGEATWLHGDDTSRDLSSASAGVHIEHGLLFASLYGQTEVSIAHKLQLTLGLRGDFSDVFQSELSPRAGLVLLPYATGTFKLLYAHGFIHPSWYDTFFDDKMSIAANGKLGPERADNYELVVQQQLGRPILLTASLFYIHGDQLIEQRSICVSQMDPCPSTDVRDQSQNARSFQSLGAELGLVGRFSWGARFYANYSWAHATDDTGVAPLNSPEHLWKAGFSMPLWRDHLVAGVEGRYWSSRVYQQADAQAGTPALSTDPFVDLSAHLTWRDLPRGLNLTIKLHDLTAAAHSEPSVVENSQPFARLPQSGFSVVTRLSYGF